MGRYVRPDDERFDDVRVSKRAWKVRRTAPKWSWRSKARPGGEPAEDASWRCWALRAWRVELKSLIKQYDLPEDFTEEAGGGGARGGK